MTGRAAKNNWVCVTGEIVSDLYYSHEVLGERFYLADLAVKRLSDRRDVLPILLSEQLIDAEEDMRGQMIRATGQFRSFSRHDGLKNRLILSVFVRELTFLKEEGDISSSNQIYLDGYICKMPVYRHTPLGKEIADLFMAVNRPYGKSDYIPCIAWGKNARLASGFSISTRIQIWGRIQSREYLKKISDENAEKRLAYEVSINRIECGEPLVDNFPVSC